MPFTVAEAAGVVVFLRPFLQRGARIVFLPQRHQNQVEPVLFHKGNAVLVQTVLLRVGQLTGGIRGAVIVLVPWVLRPRRQTEQGQAEHKEKGERGKLFFHAHHAPNIYLATNAPMMTAAVAPMRSRKWFRLTDLLTGSSPTTLPVCPFMAKS